jgi:phage/plasmid-like protein (TIGR03299 family)
MSHDLNYNKERETWSMFSRKEMPWHGLGQILEEYVTAEEALKLANLDFPVVGYPVFANFIPSGWKVKVIKDDEDQIIGYRSYNDDGETISLKSKGEKIPNEVAIYRDDTKEYFGTVTDDYEIVQNYEALDIIFGIIKDPNINDRNDIVIETAGCLGKGETIFVTAELPPYVISNKGGFIDRVRRFVVFTSSHNKSGKLVAMITDVRVVCNNTLQAALQSTPNKIALKHTKNVRERFDQFQELVHVADAYSTAIKEHMEVLIESEITKEDINNYVLDLFASKKNLKYLKLALTTTTIDKLPTEMVSTKFKNKFNDILAYIDQGAGQDVCRGTAYWLYNGVTGYLHNAIAFRDQDTRFSSIMDGSTSLLINNAFTKILQYVR